MGWVTGGVHGGRVGAVVPEVDDQIVFRGFDALEILVVEVGLDEGLIMVGMADGQLVDGQHLRGAVGTL